jgi:membrane-associated phospholipid phosphatase
MSPTASTIYGAIEVSLSLAGVAWAARADGLHAVHRNSDPQCRPNCGDAPLIARVGLLLLGGFLALAICVQQRQVCSEDLMLIRLVRLSGDHDLTSAMTLVSMAAGPLLAAVLVPLGALVLLVRRRARSLRLYLATVIGIVGVEGVFKGLVHRPRPPFGGQLVHPHLDSFPSGHVLGITVFLGVFLFLTLPSCRAQWLKWALVSGCALWVVLTAASRVYLGAHYLTDTIGGLVLGIAWVLLCASMHLRLSKPRPLKTMEPSSALMPDGA